MFVLVSELIPDIADTDCDQPTEGWCFPCPRLPVLPPLTPGACGNDLKTQIEGQWGQFPKAESRTPRKLLLFPSQGPSHVMTRLNHPLETLGAPSEEGRHFPPVLLALVSPFAPYPSDSWAFAAGAHSSLDQLSLTSSHHTVFSPGSVLSCVERSPVCLRGIPGTTSPPPSPHTTPVLGLCSHTVLLHSA